MAHTMMRNVSSVNQMNSPASVLPANSSCSGLVVSVVPGGTWKTLCSLSSRQRHRTGSESVLSLKSRPLLFEDGKLAATVQRRRFSPEDVSGARCFSTTSVPEEGVAGVPGLASFMQSAMVVMKREYGAFGGATLEKSELEISPAQVKTSPLLEDGGGSGGIGNINNHGGGHGGDDDGDDDDYFGEDDDGEDGDNGGFFGRRVFVPEVFDRKFVEAILQEWFITMRNLPAGIRQAVEMGLISTALVVRFITLDARPTLTRAISRSLPSNVSRALIGRILADPSFLYKVAMEQVITIGLGVWWEVHHRGNRLKDEWGLAATNVLTMSVCNAAALWCLSPSRSYGQIFMFDWQNALQRLPNHCFDASYPLREFSKKQRIFAFVYKSFELGLIGVIAGIAGAGLARITPHPKETSVPVPSVSRSALSYGAFLGLSGNFRYQLLYGADRLIQRSLNNIGLVVFCSTALRMLNIQIGDVSRLFMVGFE